MAKIKSGKEFINTLTTAIKSKNPFAVLFLFSDIKEEFSNVSDNLMNYNEVNYTDEAKDEYLKIVEEYRKEGFYETLYNYYLDENLINNPFNKHLDKFFDESFYKDISFFYYTIQLISIYKITFETLYLFSKNQKIYEKYKENTNYLRKKDFLNRLIPENKALKYDKEIYFLVKTLDVFSDFDFSQIKFTEKENEADNVIHFMKLLTLSCLSWKKSEYRWYFLDNFATKKSLYKEFIDNFTLEEKTKVISYLRRDILSETTYRVNFSTLLEPKDKRKLSKLVVQSLDLSNKNTKNKIKFLLSKEKEVRDYWKIKGEIFRVAFKREVMSSISSDLVDLTLWISNVPREVFYVLKHKTNNLSLENLGIYKQIKELILTIDKSSILRLLKPFLYQNIISSYNKNSNKYYLTKFITSVILTDNYTEYQKVSQFYNNLEVFYWNSFSAFVWKISLYWWLIVASLLLLMFAPFGLTIIVLLFAFKWIFWKLLHKINPKLSASLNFGLTWYLWFIGAFILVMAWTVWLKDNVSLNYESYKPYINALVLPSNNAISILENNVWNLKASVLDRNFKKQNDGINFSDIDYLTWKDLSSLKKEPQKVKEIVRVVEVPVNPKNYDTDNKLINKNNTLWDHATEYAISCDINVSDSEIYSSINKFLILNRSELLSYIPTNKRIKTSQIPNYLPEIKYDLSWLKDIICTKK